MPTVSALFFVLLWFATERFHPYPSGVQINELLCTGSWFSQFFRIFTILIDYWISRFIHYSCGDTCRIWVGFNTLWPRQNGRHFPDDIFNCIFLDGNAWISTKISLNFIPRCPINNISALVQIMAWRRSGDNLLSEPMLVSLLTHICVTRPQWVKAFYA